MIIDLPINLSKFIFSDKVLTSRWGECGGFRLWWKYPLYKTHFHRLSRRPGTPLGKYTLRLVHRLLCIVRPIIRLRKNLHARVFLSDWIFETRLSRTFRNCFQIKKRVCGSRDMTLCRGVYDFHLTHP